MIPDSPDSPPPLSINASSSNIYSIQSSASSPPKRSSLGKRDAQRALSSVRFNAPPSPSPQPPSPNTPPHSQPTAHNPASSSSATTHTRYGSSGESRPLFFSLSNAQKKGKQWLKRTRRALTLSSLNLGDGSNDTSNQPADEGIQRAHSLSSGQYHAVVIKGGVGEEEGEAGEDDTEETGSDSAFSPSRLRIASLLSTPVTSTPNSPARLNQPSSSSLTYSRGSSVNSSGGLSSSSSTSSTASTSLFHRTLNTVAAFLHRHDLLAPLTDPTGEYRRFWLLLIFAFLLYNAISVPLRLSFTTLYNTPHTIVALTCIDYLSDLFFLLDVVLYFYTPYLSDGILERDAKAIKHHYLVSWFWPDLIASFPFDLVALAALPLHKALPLRLLRLLRFAKYDQYFSVWEQYSTRFPQLIRFSKLILGMMLILHWLACMWFACGYWRGFGTTVWLPSADIEDEGLSTQYVYAFWWATNIVTQVGGDPGLPSNDAERLMDLCIAFLSVFVVAVVIGNVNELVSELNAQESALREKLQTLNHFMITRRLPTDLQQRIRSYYLTIWVRRGGVDDAAIMEELPNTLRTEISLVMNQDILGKVPIFASSSTGFIHSLVQHLKLQTYGPKELIVREGDIGSEMYFVSRGQVNVIVGDRTVGTIGSGGFFGEIAVLQDMAVRTASIEAVNYCDLFVLTHEDMSNLFKNFPAEKQIILHVADTRRAKDMLRRQLNDDKLLVREKVGGGIADGKLVQLLLDLFKPIAMGAGADLRHDHGQGNSGHVSDDDESGDHSEAGGGGGVSGARQRVLHEHGLYEGDNGELIDIAHYGVIFSQHQSADTLYFIGKGAVDILSYPPDTSPRADGDANNYADEPVEPTVVCRLTEGMFFGCILLDGEYRVSAVIPYEFHQDTIIFALTYTDLPMLHAYYDAITDVKLRSRTKRVLNTLLRRYQNESDYRMALTPLPSPLSSRGGSERELRARDVTPKRLGALIRVVSRSARQSRRGTIASGQHLLSDSSDEEEDGAEGEEGEEVEEKRGGEEREEKKERVDDSMRRRPSESSAASASAPTIITISAATETTPLTATTTLPTDDAPRRGRTTTPPPSTAPTVTTEPIPAFSASLLQTAPASLLGNLSSDLSSPLGRSSSASPTAGSPLRSASPPHSPTLGRTHLLRSSTDSSDMRRRSLSHSPAAPLSPPGDGGRSLRSHSMSVDPTDPTEATSGSGRSRSTSSQQPSLSPRLSSEAHKRAVAPFNFLLHMHDRHGATTGSGSSGASMPPSPLMIATRLPAAHRRQNSGGGGGGGGQQGSDLSPSPLSPADVSPRSSSAPRRSGVPTSPVMGGVSGSVSGRVQFLERALNTLTNDELVLLCNRATMKLYGRLQQQQEERANG